MDDAPPTPLPPTQYRSRLLAALDHSSPYASSSLSQLPPASSGLPPPLQTPARMRTESPYAYDDDFQATARALSQKRSFSEYEDDLDDDVYDYFDVGPSGSSLPLGSTIRNGGEFTLRYDTETPLRRIDVGGDDQDLRMAEFVSRGIENAGHDITVEKAVTRLGLQDIQDYIPGMEVKLLPHQLIGVSWMIDQERETPHKGGILADDMGLGKTVQMIATMTINQPSEEDKSRSTLIIVPAALLLQWKEELETRTNNIFDVHIQHGKDKIKDARRLQEKDVVITTYHTLNLDFGIPKDLDEDELAWVKKHGGPMSQTKWYRVVCDEAQFIRNRSTRCSAAVAMLRAKYRWCLTGTPVTNTLADIYGYLRFGHFRPYNDWQAFNEHIAKVQVEDAPCAGMRAQVVLKPILLRRTKDGKLENGEPILQLRPKDVELVYLEFSSDERQLYDLFEKRAQVQINRFIKSRTLLKNAQTVLILILRLRQICTHPYLVLHGAEGLGDPSALIGSDAEKELARATKFMGPKWVANIKQRYIARARAIQLDMEENDEEEEPLCSKCGDLFLENNGRILSCGDEICADCVEDLASSAIEHNGDFGNNDDQTNFRIEKEFENAAAKGLRPCPKCKKMQDLRPNSVFLAAAFMPSQEEVRAAPKSKPKPTPKALPPPPPPAKRRKVVTLSDLSSSDSDSDSDLPDLSALLRSSPKGKDAKWPAKVEARGKPAAKGTPAAKGKKAPPKKGARRAKALDSDEDMGSSSDSDSDADPRGRRGSAKAPAKGKGKGKQDEKEESAPAEPDMAVFEMWKQGGNNVEPSAKMLQMIKYLKEWEATGDKTIVFSQWTSMLDLCEQIFARHGIRSLRYDGKMSREAREFCLTQFRQPAGGPKVVLVSIKCGGVGLNLVAANRVINLDLSWNYAVESQAYDRVHRLGQEKDVVVKRLVVRNTIEERMLKLQDTKLGLAEAALGEGSGTRLQKLSVKQIKDLFGMTRLNNQRNDGRTPSQSQ